MRDALDTPRTYRYTIAGILTGRAVRTAADVASIAACVAAGSLSAMTGSTFGLFQGTTADDSCSITSGAAVLTSPNNPWTAADVGKLIDVAGAGAAGATLRSRIKTYTNAGSVTLWDNASTTVAASKTSAGGLAAWGSDLTASAVVPKSGNEAGTTETSNLTLAPLATSRPVARSMAARLAEVFDVADYGAVGDGVTDDTTALNLACAALVANGGGVLRFEPAKVYMHAAYIGLASVNDFTIEGRGATLKSIAATAATSANAGLRLSACSRFVVRDLVVDGNRANRTPAENPNHNVILYSCTDGRLERVRAINATCDGFYLDNNAPATIGSVCLRIALLDCYANNCYRQGCSQIAGQQITYDRCEFSGTTGTAPQAGLDIESDVGHAAGSNAATRIINCVFKDNVGLGLQMTSTGSPRDIVVEGCRFSNNTAGGISQGARDVKIVNCTFDTFTASTRGIIDIPSPGVALWNANTHIRGCTFRDISAAQFSIYQHGSSGGGLVVEGNTFKTVAKGVVVNLPRTIVQGNVFDTLTGSGIELAGAAQQYGLIANNEFYAVAGYTVYLAAGSDYTTVRGNTFLDCNNSAGGGAANGTIRVLAAACVIRDNVMRLAASPDAAHVAILLDVANNYTSGNLVDGYATASDGAGETLGTAAPVAGTWKKGDRVKNRAPAVGSAKAWVCTVAGTPGTWVSEGNL